MAKDKETSTREEEVQKERQARITKLIKTLEAGADKDDQKFRRVEKLDKERIKLAKKEAKFEELGQQLWQSTFGGLFKGMTGAVPEPIKILGRMVGVAFGAKGRIRKKKKKLLQKAYKRAAAIGLDTAGWEEKTPEALEEIVENAELLHEIKMPEEPKVEKAEGKPYDPIGWLLGKGPSGEVPGEEPAKTAAIGEGAFASSPVIEKLTEISNSLTTLVELGGGEAEAEPGEATGAKPGLLSRMGSKVSGMAKSVKGSVSKGITSIFGGGDGEEGGAGASMTGGEGGLSEEANKAIIDLSDAALSRGSIFVHDLQALEFLKSTMDTPAEKKEKQMELAAETKRGADRWEKLFKILRGMGGADGKSEEGGGFFSGLLKGFGVPGLLSAIGGMAMILKFGLPGAIIIWGITSAVFIVKDWIRGFKEGGITGGIGQALGGAGEGLMNAFKQSIKWGGIGATIGMIVGSVVPGFGTIVGALIGGLIGMALGALFGYIGGDRITKGLNKAGEAVKRGWNAMMKWLGDTTKAIGNWIYTPKSTHPDHPDSARVFGMALEWPKWMVKAGETFLSRVWNPFTEWLGDLVRKIGNWIYTPKGTHPDHPSPAILFGITLEWPVWMVKAGQKLKAGWDALTTWFSNTIEKIGAWLYTPGGDTGPGGMGEGTGPTIFGVQLPTLPAIGNAIDKAWNALTGWVKDVGKWFWDDGKMFGGRFTIPKLEFPDLAGMLENMKRKFTGGLAEMLSNVPKMFLSAEAEAWIEANRDPAKAAKARLQEATDLGAQLGPDSDLTKDLAQQVNLRKEKERKSKEWEEGWLQSNEGKQFTGLQKLKKDSPDLFLPAHQEHLDKLTAAKATHMKGAMSTAKSDKEIDLENQRQEIIDRLMELQATTESDQRIINEGPPTSTGGVNKSVTGSTGAARQYTPRAGGGVTQSGTKKVSGEGNITRLKVGDEHLSQENLARKGTDEFDSQAGVAEAYAPQFQGFVQDLLGTGYKINYFGGYRKSDVAGSDKASWHQSGMAIDINKDTNPMYKPANKKVGPDTPGAKPLGRDGRWIITDMPDNIYEIAQKWGLGWGGKWLNTVDAMHFSVAKKEGGSVASEDVTRGMVPILAAAQGLIGFVKQPTLILAGEKGPESVNIRPSSSQQASGLMPAAAAGGGTTIINAPDNSTAIATSTNNQLNQDPGWAVLHTPVYQRGRYAA